MFANNIWLLKTDRCVGDPECFPPDKMNSSSNSNDWQTVPERRQQPQYSYRGGRPQYGRPRPSMYAPPLPPPETPLKKTDANFPHLVPKAPKKASPEFATSFSKTVAEMAKEEEDQRLREAYAKDQESKAQSEFDGVYILGSIRTDTVRNTVRSFVRELADEFDVAEEFEREEYDTAAPPPNSEDDGWVSVQEKARKSKKELTTSELAAKYVAAGEAADRDEEEFNGDLFYSSHRHDHR